MKRKREKLLIFDGSNVMMRAFFAVPQLVTSKGFHTNAIKGVINIVVSVILNSQPTHVAFVMDRKAPTHRHKIFKAYKGNREKDPEQQARLIPQRKPMYDLLTAMGIKVVHKSGVEADDIVGTLTRLAVEADMDVEIVSNDKDMAQLLDEGRVTLLKYQQDIKGYVEITRKNCAEHYLVPPKRIPCMLMMKGDKVDNIPGVDSIGDAAILKLVATAKRIEDSDLSVLNKTQRANFEAARDRFRLVRRLVTIHRDIMPIKLEKLRPGTPDTKMIHFICKALEAGAIRSTVQRYVKYLN
jgi:DNA polymerase-1